MSTLLAQPEAPTPCEAVPKWCERAVQDVVYVYCAIKDHEIIVPNSCVFDWESDVVSVTGAGVVHEFEIKVTRADFMADAKKARARRLLDPAEPRPNYFWYVTQEGLIAPGDVPGFAGLIYALRPTSVNRFGRPRLFRNAYRVVKPAAKLHGEKLTEKQRRQLARATTERFWRQRIRQTAPVVEDIWP